MVLSKSDILKGKNNYEEVELNNADGSICIRPLTIAEIHQISEMKNKAIGDYIANQKGTTSRRKLQAQIEAQAKMNMERVTKADNKADIKTVYWGLDNPGNPDKYSEEEVTQLDKPIFDEILQHVKEISHMDDDEVEDDVEDFHEEE